MIDCVIASSPCQDHYGVHCKTIYLDKEDGKVMMDGVFSQKTKAVLKSVFTGNLELPKLIALYDEMPDIGSAYEKEMCREWATELFAKINDSKWSIFASFWRRLSLAAEKTSTNTKWNISIVSTS